MYMCKWIDLILCIEFVCVWFFIFKICMFINVLVSIYRYVYFVNEYLYDVMFLLLDRCGLWYGVCLSFFFRIMNWVKFVFLCWFFVCGSLYWSMWIWMMVIFCCLVFFLCVRIFNMFFVRWKCFWRICSRVFLRL